MEPAVSSMLESTPFQNTRNRRWCFDPYLPENGGLYKITASPPPCTLPTYNSLETTYLLIYLPTYLQLGHYLPTHQPHRSFSSICFAICFLLAGATRGGGGGEGKGALQPITNYHIKHVDTHFFIVVDNNIFEGF